MASIGLISDTHGLLRPEVVDVLRGSDHIIHAGDIGGSEILDSLGRLAPVTAVRGNNDSGPWAEALPDTALVVLASIRILVVHDLQTLDGLMPGPADFRCVVNGHSHRPGYSEKEGVLYINPGSAGPRRFRLPISVGRLLVSSGGLIPQLYTVISV